MPTKNRSQSQKNEEFAPIVPLVPRKHDSDDNDKSNFITFELMVIAGSNAAGKYKKTVRLFDDGSPDEFIKMMDDLDDIYKQNKIDDAPDQNALIESILKGNSKENYLMFMSEERGTDTSGNLNTITKEMLTKVMNKMKMEVFPYRALDRQKSWMKRKMRKPDSLSVRRLSGAVSRMNDKLTYFPKAKVSDKFSEKDMLELIEWALHPKYREHFDKQGFVPTDNSREDLIKEAEIVEREFLSNKNKNSNNRTNKHKNSNKRKTSENKEGKKYCSKCGWNNTHEDSGCWKQHPELRPGSNKRSKKNKSTEEMNLIEERNQLINRINKSFEKKLAKTCEESSEDEEDQASKRKQKKKTKKKMVSFNSRIPKKNDTLEDENKAYNNALKKRKYPSESEMFPESETESDESTVSE